MSYFPAGSAGLLLDKGGGYKAFGSQYPLWGAGYKHATPRTTENDELPPAMVPYLETTRGSLKCLKFEMDDGELEEVTFIADAGPEVLWVDGTKSVMRWWPGMTATEREVALVTVARRNHKVKEQMKVQKPTQEARQAGRSAGGLLRDPFLDLYKRPKQ
uniref:Uncharacterized protein n=1 Tax=Alexandrium catenella TaxID=2925 RepID=A0A7S1W8K4_ALECA|mmetsp:Transcript_43499/g.117311  ORF Transcript_43499/g.117311 Transcript_43499/m.117311 type:complete len:159 (+) Transcript_43499:69-545(+)|eukprot:CAMPEP_0171158636 /NCGR_PEP_ID=MMETSP0790-20130122/2614_1 /TAXON_ID=2925 /ORGANISM="Alexandrium catenella, Strain OF101" /LENGTH=158 /DNA_ID=CAMNT_0011623085 /DNA_START=62 /DNA_END=538 /DNA_ORIENTATION=+